MSHTVLLQQSLLIFTAGKNDCCENKVTAGVASTVTCLLHFLELGLELRHQGKSDLVKGEQSCQWSSY